VNRLELHDWHQRHGATFIEVGGDEVVDHYGEVLAEHGCLTATVGLLDLSLRGRLCVLGPDRERFLQGQLSQDLKALRPNQGCLAALLTAKGKLEADLNVYRLADEHLLDFEPGQREKIAQRLARYVIAEDVQVIDAAPHYGLLSLQGPQAEGVLRRLAWAGTPPTQRYAHASLLLPQLGAVYLVNQPRTGSCGYDLYVPTAALETVAGELAAAAARAGGRWCGWQALELARVEAAIPRYGVDMDESTLPPEAGLETRAISYTKGCYIGQEIIARLRTYGQVSRALRGLRLEPDLPQLPAPGDPLLQAGREVGKITSAIVSPARRQNLALGYVRREVFQLGTELRLRTLAGESAAHLVTLPFEPFPFPT